MKIGFTSFVDDASDTVVAAMSATFSSPDPTRRQIYVIEKYNSILGLNLKKPLDCTHRTTT
jgi:hypothetical protein